MPDGSSLVWPLHAEERMIQGRQLRRHFILGSKIPQDYTIASLAALGARLAVTNGYQTTWSSTPA